MIQEAVERIRQMEQYFDLLQKVADENPSTLRENGPAKAALRTLIRYYENGQWLLDYELDETGLLPPDLKRGVLSQDGIYNLLTQLQEK